MEEIFINTKKIEAWIKKYLLRLVLGLFLLIGITTAVKTIEPEEEGVVLTLGKYSRTLDPGMNFIAPFGIEKMYKIPVQRQLKQEFGFRTEGRSGSHSTYSEQSFADESLMLTGDLNLGAIPHQQFLSVFVQSAQRRQNPARHGRIGCQKDCGRPHRKRSAHRGAAGSGFECGETAAANVRGVRKRHPHRPGSAAGRESARNG
jgi:hypothetical protein